METDNDEADRVRGLLRSVRKPGFRRDIIAAGFVKDIEVEAQRVTVHFAPDRRDQVKIEQMEADIRDALGGVRRFDRVHIPRHQPFVDTGVLSCGGMTPAQTKMREDDVVAVIAAISMT